MRVGVVCPTYKRPELLGRAIFCFLQQTYPDAYLVVLDDAGQYKSQKHGRWELVSTSTRYPSLGAKRQAGIDMLSRGTQAYFIIDDDDVYWPHAIASAVKALEKKPWAQCRMVYETVRPGVLAAVPAFSKGTDLESKLWGYGGCWSYRMDTLRKVGGYDPDPAKSCNDDLDLARRVFAHYGVSGDSSAALGPWYWYNREPSVSKICDEGVKFWEIRGRLPFKQMDCPPIGWNGPNLYEYKILRGIHPRPF